MKKEKKEKEPKYNYTDDQINCDRPKPSPRESCPSWIDYDELMKWWNSWTISGVTYNRETKIK